MASEVTGTSEEARKVLETEACLARARAVLNAMSIAMSCLERADVPAEWHDRARETIDAAWATLAHRTVATEYRLRLMREVDNAATTKAEGTVLGEEVLARLPPELVMLFVSYAEDLGLIVEARRKQTPGRGPGASRGKWAMLAALWERATGEVIKPSAWEETWKSTRREEKKVFDEAVARAKEANAKRSLP